MPEHLLPLTYTTELLAGRPVFYLCGVQAPIPLKFQGDILCPDCLAKVV